MGVEQAVEAYFRAWDDHDRAAVEACFADGGTFEDPTTGGPVSGGAIGDAVDAFATAFPDNRLPITRIDVVDGTRAIVEFRMQGTNSGDSPLGPATGGAVDVPGVDVITLDGDGRITCVRGYWDMAAFLTGLGLQSNPSPVSVPGLIEFGVGVRVLTGRDGIPGCFTVTSTDAGDLDTPWVQQTTPTIIEELMATPGYLGSCMISAAGRHYTFTAWSDEESVRALHQTSHREAMRAMLAGERCTRIMTSLWSPLKLNTTKAGPGGGVRPTAADGEGQWL